jgi:3,4-dihydroxy-9,10-secoandrosta-1,3,5(10)-triene-9,17-dione 4,5-dioxygenase
MSAVTQLGYLGVGVKDLGEWAAYARETLGLGVAATDSDGTLLLRLDAHHHRFALHEDAHDDIAYSGWQVDTAADLDAIGARLEAAGTDVTRGTAEDAERRRVRGLVKFQDPDCHAVEVFYGPQMASTPFASQKGGTRFVAGAQGLGHFVLAANDLDRTMSFYTEMLGMKVSDYITRGRLKLGFLHCNPRHHSIAFVEFPNAPKRANHFMLQLDDFDAVGRTWDNVQSGAAPVIMTLGRHSNDEMVSFYMRNPSGFGVEYGWGAREVDDSCWQVAQYDITSTWGHKSPTPAQA